MGNDLHKEPSAKESPRFDWAVYADATFAGLAALIPLPIVDLYFEWLFRRRMVRAIALKNGRILNAPTINKINRNRSNRLSGCLLWPFKLLYSFIKKLSRKILYFLAIKEAVDNLNYYWHRAFLLDHMMQAGYLDNSQAEIEQAALTLHIVLETTSESPLLQLARQVVGSGRHILLSLWRWRRHGEEDETAMAAKEQMKRRWHDFNAYFQQLLILYDKTYVMLSSDSSSTNPDS